VAHVRALPVVHKPRDKAIDRALPLLRGEVRRQYDFRDGGECFYFRDAEWWRLKNACKRA
jgi:hypothetical protein